MELPPVAKAARVQLGAVALALTLLAHAAPAHADWPVPRGDTSRTAAVDSRSNLRDPAVSWRYYLGGAISHDAARLHDLDGDQLAEVVFVSAGRLIAKGRTGSPLWQTPIHGIRSIVSIADFDGDGQDEIAARSRARIFLVDARSGAIRWASPPQDFNAVDAVRVGDVDNDGRPDLVAASCPCCRVAAGDPGHAYGFAAGFDADPTAHRLWSLPATSCGGRYSMVLWDPDGDGRLDATFSTSDSIGVVVGATGQSCLDTSVPSCQEGIRQFVAPLDLGARANASQCLAADMDNLPGDELVCVQNNASADQPDNAHRVFVLGYRPASVSASARLEVRWQRIIGTRARFIAIGSQPIADLDDDGSFEIVVSGFLADDRWATYVLDAATGAELAELVDQRILGAIDLSASADDPAGSAGHTILTERASTLWAWSFQRQSSPRIRGRWSLPDRAPITEIDTTDADSMYPATRIGARDITGDGRAELLLIDGARQGLYIHDVTGITTTEVAAHRAEGASTILEVWTLPAQPDESAAVFVATSDGLMRSLDENLGLVTDGLRFGGYYPKGDWRNLHITPVTGDLGAGADSVIVTDARGALIRVDAQAGQDSSEDDPEAPTPSLIWSMNSTSYPIIVPGLVDGAPGIACRQIDDDGTRRIRVVAADGQPVRDHDINGDGDARMLSDLVPAHLDGDGVPDLIMQWAQPGDLDLHIEALDGATLTSKWHIVPPLAGTTRFPAGGAITDWNGDGIDDYIHQYYRTQIISGADGSMLDESPENGVYYMPIVTQLDDDPQPELLLQGGFDPVRAVDDDLASMWTSPQDTRPYPYGALARCGAATYLVEGSLAQPSTLHRTRVDMGAVADGAPTDSWARVLAHGHIYADIADAQADGDYLGQLTSTVVHSNLAGDGRPVALVGSEDGFLYAIDVCAGAVEFTMQFDGSVGAIAFGDTDGDSFDELLVAVADGYLYAIDNGDESRRGYLVGCQCNGGAPTPGAWLLGLLVGLRLLWRRRRRRC